MTQQLGAETALIPTSDPQRTAGALTQFWIWAGANLAPINWVLGALGIVLGLSFTDTVLVLVVGNLIGMAVFGLFVLMGHRTGVSQMVLARGAFGRRGAIPPALMQGVIAIGWCAVNTWIVLDLLVALFGTLGFHADLSLKIVLVVVIMGLQVWIGASGFNIIAKFEKWTVPVTLVILVVMTVVAFTQVELHLDVAGTATGTSRIASLSTMMTAIGIGWGITWFAYASDYSRFVRCDVSSVKVYLASTLGQFIPVVWLGVFGAALATNSATADPGQLVVGAFGALAIPVILMVIHGPIATNILNIYSSSLAAQTIGLKVNRRVISIVVGIFAAVVVFVLVAVNDIATSLDSWLIGLVTWVAPWAGVMLVYYFVVARGRVDTDALFDETGTRLPSVRWGAVVSFVIGLIATWLFEFGPVPALQGPIATALGGVDLSWLAGGVVAGGLYAVLHRFDRHTQVDATLAPTAKKPAQVDPIGR